MPTEPLVVLAILGLIGAIAVPSFLNGSATDPDASTKRSVRVANLAIESWFTGHASYDATSANLRSIDPVLPAANGDFTVRSAAGEGARGAVDNFRITIKANGRSFSLTRSTAGRITRTCSVDAGAHRGGCPANRHW